ncbi:hypothetical protein JXB28_04240 [Candidatus Woesearchaeota archaeon]|nr:hypothetical protein [Candidatus Woesearchaeota archaeon]
MSRQGMGPGLLSLGIGIGMMFSYVMRGCPGKADVKPKDYSGLEDKVKVEYVKPSQVECPKWADIDGDGKYETAMRIDGKDYLFRFNGQGKPELSLYSVIPPKVEPGQIVIEK